MAGINPVSQRMATHINNNGLTTVKKVGNQITERVECCLGVNRHTVTTFDRQGKPFKAINVEPDGEIRRISLDEEGYVI